MTATKWGYDFAADIAAIEHACDDPSERVREWDLSTDQRDVWEAGYMVGFAAAAPALLAEIQQLRDQVEQANRDADRYYAEMCRRPAPREPAQRTYADLARARGDHAAAARHDARLNAMFPAFAH